MYLCYVVHFVSVNDIQGNPKRFLYRPHMHVMIRDPNVLRNNFAHRRGSLPRIHSTDTTQLKACKSILSSEKPEEEKRERKKKMGENTALKN